MLLGSLVIYAFGLVWLAGWLAQAGQETDPIAVLNMGMTPFLPGDFLKAALAMWVTPAAWKLIGARQGS